MSDTKINVKVNKDNTVSISVEMELKKRVWSKKHKKFLPNEDYQRFHWIDAVNHLKEKGHDVVLKPKSGPHMLRNDSEETRAGTWIFDLKSEPKPKTKTTKKITKKKTKPKEA